RFEPMIQNVDVIVREVVGALYRYDALGLERFAPARVADYAKNISSLADITAVLSQAALALSVVFGAILLYVMIQRKALATASVATAPVAEVLPSSGVPGALRSRWDEIAGHLDSTRENDWKLAVLEADKLVDSALMRVGFGGDTF